MASSSSATNPFGTDSMASGYATSRPPIHEQIIHRLRGKLRSAGVSRGLDIGCGAGLSTRALQGLADHCVGIEPAESMLHWSAGIAPDAEFIVARAEAIPLAADSIDLMTAAGSLNYADLTRFFPEAERVLKSDGELVVYDFSPGRAFRDSIALGEWFSTFTDRYPWPPQEAQEVDPEKIAQVARGFHVREHERFRIGLTITPEFYLDYMMSESNVAYAIRMGTAEAEIRSWCSVTLEPVWEGRSKVVMFEGYFACLVKDPEA